MSKIFAALDTSGSQTYAAVANDGVLESLIAAGGLGHNEEVVSVFETLLARQSLSTDKLNQLVVGLGPGSFTGLRIGLSFMKGLSHSRRVPIFGYGSLLAAAFGVFSDGIKVALSDAGRNQFFVLVAERSGETFKTIFGPEILDWQQIEKKTAELVSKNTEIIDCGMAEMLLQSLGIHQRCVSPPNIAESLLKLHMHSYNGAGAFKVEELAAIVPLYIRPVSALSLADRGVSPPRL